MARSMDFELSSSQYVYANDSASTSITGDLSGEAWFKPETIGINQMVLSKSLDTSNQISYGFFITTTNKLQAFFSDNGTIDDTHYVVCATDDAQITSTGKWWHVAFSFDISGEDCKFYVGDVDTEPALKASSLIFGTTIGATLDNNASAFSMGARKYATPNNYVDGKIFNTRLWSDVRTITEFQDNYKTILTNTGTNNLNDAWLYDNNLTSASGNNDLTAVNAPVFTNDVPFGAPVGRNPIFFSTGGLAIN